MNDLISLYPKKVRNFLKLLEKVTLIVAIIAITSLFLEFGLRLGPKWIPYLHFIDIFIVIFFISESIIKISMATYKGKLIKQHWLEFFIAIFISTLFFGGAFLRLGRILQVSKAIRLTVFTRLVLSIQELFYSLIRFTQTKRWRLLINSFSIKPAQSILLSFFLVIFIGTLLLMLPSSCVYGKNIRFIDALFTSTSAVCVTGLVVFDIGTNLSTFGQSILLTLIQIGGLGLMTFSSFFALLLTQKTDIGRLTKMQDVLDLETTSKVRNLIINMIKFTFIIEAVGAILIFLSWRKSFSSLTSAIYNSVFHSISAFCNSGFSTFHNSFEGFRDNYLFNIIIISLIISGGLGFFVLANIYNKFYHRKEKIARRLTMHSKLVITTTIILLIIGALLFGFLEKDNTLKGLTLPQKIISSTFQSATPRTAGFNVIPTGKLTNATLFLFILFMFIGASPGSTGGGIKTSTFGIALVTVYSLIKNKENVEIFGRSIDKDSIYKAFSIIISSIIIIFISLMGLLIIEKIAFEKLLFEVFSAFGTVGLSTGVTKGLSDLGKLIIIITMFIGRIGSLTLVMALSITKKKGKYTYPKGKLMIG